MLLYDGYTLTLQIMQDNFDYGTDKNGNPRENNVLQNFDATVLTRHTPIKKGDKIRLHDYDEEHSYVIGFNLLLR